MKDELTKNHKNPENLVSGVMPENKTDPMCPVQSFCDYISHLNPESEYMWQYPLEKIYPDKPEIWYSKKHLGKNPLAVFMSELSREAQLSKIYTNHCIRATGITVLTDAKFSNADIMLVSGHKSVQSLSVYQKTDEKKKIQMGQALGKSMKKQDSTPAIAPPKEKLAIEPGPSKFQVALQSKTAVMPKDNAPPAIIPFIPNFQEDEDLADLDLLSAICDIESTQHPIIFLPTPSGK